MVARPSADHSVVALAQKPAHHLDALMAHVATHPDATLAELVEWSAAKRGVTVCVATTWATLEALGVTLKKRPVTPQSKSARMLQQLGKPARDPGRAQHQYLSSSTMPTR